jgi:hypothetical protein
MVTLSAATPSKLTVAVAGLGKLVPVMIMVVPVFDRAEIEAILELSLLS